MKIADYKKQMMKDPKVRKAYFELQWDVAHNISMALVHARAICGMTQKELAEKMGTKQSAIARAEGGSIVPSNTFLNDAAKAMGLVLDIKFKKPYPPNHDKKRTQ